MMNKDIQYYVATALGYSDYDAFYAVTGIKVSLDIYKGVVFQNERDMLYASYTLASSIYLGALKVDMDPFVDKEHLKLLKAKVSAKLRQHHVLERIKAKAIEEIKRYVSESFNIEAGLLHTSDIRFKNYWSFEVAGVSFRYSGTLVNEKFVIQTSNYISHANAYEMVTKMNNYFNLKKKEYDSKY
jgi:hypothetical protein